MKIRQKSVFVKSGAIFEVYDELQMLKLRHETTAVLAEHNIIREQLHRYKHELVQVARELRDELSWDEFGDYLIHYATKGEQGNELERREHWARHVVLPVVAAIAAVMDYFSAMDTVKTVRLATGTEATDNEWDVVVQFSSGHTYGVMVRNGSNVMRLKGKTVWFGLPYRCMDGMRVRKDCVHELDQRFFNEIEGVRTVHK